MAANPQLTEEEVEEEFDADLYKDGLDWLELNHPRIADKMKLLLRYGWTPERVFTHVVDRLGSDRDGLAKRCENALRYLMWEQKK
jgi:hypothetical protein